MRGVMPSMRREPEKTPINRWSDAQWQGGWVNSRRRSVSQEPLHRQRSCWWGYSHFSWQRRDRQAALCFVPGQLVPAARHPTEHSCYCLLRCASAICSALCPNERLGIVKRILAPEMSRCQHAQAWARLYKWLALQIPRHCCGGRSSLEYSVTSAQRAAAKPEQLLPPWTGGCPCPLLGSARQTGPAGLGSGAQARALTLDAAEPERMQPPGLQAEGRILQGFVSGFGMTGRGAARRWPCIRPACDRGSQPNSDPRQGAASGCDVTGSAAHR